ncbi:MAG: hypothetical protein WCH60_05110 [Burkholderiales bacterium]
MKTIRRLLFLLVSVCALIACAKGAPEWSANVPPPPDVADLVERASNPSGLATVRVIVQFNQPVAFNDPAFLKTLQDQAQARVRYIAAVSGDTHVYSLQLPADQSAEPVLHRLGALPTVTRAELDQKAKAQ